MRRWNGWGDDSVEFAVNPEALAFLQERLGEGVLQQDASKSSVIATVAASRLPPHPLIDIDPETRLLHSLGQSLPDWLKMRFGHIEHFPDGVAFPQSSTDVRELLELISR